MRCGASAVLAVLALRWVCCPATAARILRSPPRPRTVFAGQKPTHYSSVADACHACVDHYPAREGSQCRAGPCKQLSPATGVGESESGGQSICLTLAPVSWYTPCSVAMVGDLQNVYELTRFCSYTEQIFVPPPLGMTSTFAGSSGVRLAYTRLDGSDEVCSKTIYDQGRALLDDSGGFCDSDLAALASCCSAVQGGFACTQDVGEKTGILARDPAGFDSVKLASQETMELYKTYCLPMCELTREELCAKYPKADICVKHDDCKACTTYGGQWCPDASTCSCPAAPGVSTCPLARHSPEQCGDGDGYTASANTGSGGGAASTTAAAPARDFERVPGCPFAEMVKKWEGSSP